MRVVVVNHVTLDGVFQSPARPDEDTAGGFRHGGWASAAGNDPALAEAMGRRMGQGFSWLFGRRSYEDMLGYWNATGGPFKDGLNGPVKYVATSNPERELPWPNSRRLSGDVAAEVSQLRQRDGGNLVTMGSGQLVRSLLAHSLVDELFLMIHPVVLGSGATLFGSGPDPVHLQLVDSTTTAGGVVLATYQRP